MIYPGTGGHKRYSARPNMGQMAGPLGTGLQRLTQPALLGQLDCLLENLIGLSTDERISLDEERRDDQDHAPEDELEAVP